MRTVNIDAPMVMNRAAMPWVIHLDIYVSPVFALNAKDKEHPRTPTFDAGGANLLNHAT